MAREGGSSSSARLGILGVDPTDGRALAEVPRWMPADATTLYHVPDADDRVGTRAATPPNPPRALLALARGLRGDRRSTSEDANSPAASDLTAAVEAAAAECDLPTSSLALDADAGSPAHRRRWAAGAWVATLLAIGAPLGAIGRWLLVGDLLAGLLAVLASVGGIALLVGFAFAQEAAAIRRFDHALADAAEAALASNGAGSGSTAGADREERPVLVVPARHAAGVAAILRERDVDATAQRVEIGDSPASVS